MCGICGIFSIHDEKPHTATIMAMCDTIVHRGPDDQGIYVAPHIALGQRRLTIIDLANSACPPLCNEDNSIWLVFNGEIYNYQSLRSELIQRGHSFKTFSDTEVLIHLYEEKSFDCINSIRGMFAFALWDAKKKILFCARDRLGKKPFCYTKINNGIVFGSEIKSVTAHPKVIREPDFYAIDQYLTHSFVPAPHTAFAGIQKLPPGYFLVCSCDGQINLQKYWMPEKTQFSLHHPDALKIEIINQLEEATRLRMISDVPVGAFLSGGIDSAAVVALMARNSSKQIKTFSIGFENEKFNELPYAKLIVQRYQTDHHEMIIKPDAAAILPLLVRHYNEPFADASAIPSYYVAKMAKQHVAVALSGDGGDESFAGYKHYADLMAWNLADHISPALKKMVAKFGTILTRNFMHNNIMARTQRGLAMLQCDNIKKRHDLFFTTLKQEEKQAIYSDFFWEVCNNARTRVNRISDFNIEQGEDKLSWLMRHDQSFYLPDCLMVKTDIASMANSLEVRSPFLDHKFIEFAATIPSDLKMNGKNGKVILKEALKNLLPQQILHNPKKGFSVPLAEWMRTDLATLLRYTLLSERAVKRGLFITDVLKKMIDEHINGNRDWSNRLYALLFLELWFQEFID